MSEAHDWLRDRSSFVVYGNERCPETGAAHWQGYVEFKDQVSLKQWQSVMEGVHVEPRKGTPKQAAGYCLKGTNKTVTNYEQFFEQPDPSWVGFMEGQISEQGRRTDIELACEAIANVSQPMRLTYCEHPKVTLKYHKGMQCLRNAQFAPRCLDAMPNVVVYYGTTGCGKTMKAMNDFPGERRYMWQPQKGKWFDGYDGEKIIVLDEFRGQLPYGMLLNMLDRHPCAVEVKGGMVELQADRFIITSPCHPAEWYDDLKLNDRIDQLIRRITATYCLSRVEINFLSQSGG